MSRYKLTAEVLGEGLDARLRVSPSPDGLLGLH